MRLEIGVGEDFTGLPNTIFSKPRRDRECTTARGSSIRKT
jgi:hypothetical protein